MIILYEKGERVNKEHVRSVVINEGIWKGISDEWRNGLQFDITVEKRYNDFRVEVKWVYFKIEASEFKTFDYAFDSLEYLENSALKMVGI